MEAELKTILNDEQDRLVAAQTLVDLAARWPDLVLRVATTIERHQPLLPDDDTELSHEPPDASASEAAGEKSDEDYFEDLLDYLDENPGWRKPAVIANHTGIPLELILTAKRDGTVAVNSRGSIRRHVGPSDEPADEIEEETIDDDAPDEAECDDETLDDDLRTTPDCSRPLARVQPPAEPPPKSRHQEILDTGPANVIGQPVSLRDSRDLVRAELALAKLPVTVNRLAMTTKLSVARLEAILDHPDFEKTGNYYRLRKP